jgi:hypothetical protein
MEKRDSSKVKENCHFSLDALKQVNNIVDTMTQTISDNEHNIKKYVDLIKSHGNNCEENEKNNLFNNFNETKNKVKVKFDQVLKIFDLYSNENENKEVKKVIEKVENSYSDKVGNCSYENTINEIKICLREYINKHFNEDSFIFDKKALDSLFEELNKIKCFDQYIKEFKEKELNVWIHDLVLEDPLYKEYVIGIDNEINDLRGKKDINEIEKLKEVENLENAKNEFAAKCTPHYIDLWYHFSGICNGICDSMVEFNKMMIGVSKKKGETNKQNNVQKGGITYKNMKHLYSIVKTI